MMKKCVSNFLDSFAVLAKRKKSECRMSSIFRWEFIFFKWKSSWKFVCFKWKASWISFKLLLLFMRCSKTFEEACTRLLGICPRKDHGNPACWVTATECVEVSFLQSELTFSTLSFHGSRVSRLWIEVSSVLRLVSDSLCIFIGSSSRVTLKKDIVLIFCGWISVDGVEIQDHRQRPKS